MTSLISMTQTQSALLTMAVVAVMFVMFLRETYPTEVVAMVGLSVLLLTGALEYEAALAVFSNQAP